jgi:hypothetical protein
MQCTPFYQLVFNRYLLVCLLLSIRIRHVCACVQVGYVAIKVLHGRSWRVSITAGDNGPMFTVSLLLRLLHLPQQVATTADAAVWEGVSL